MPRCKWCDRASVPGQVRCSRCLADPCCALCGDADASMDLVDGRWICGGCRKLGGEDVLVTQEGKP